jgi:GH15 family glucan-1,4-alpha-glucosidase
MSDLPIHDYGVIGDLHTVTLVGTNGSVDWWCYPHFDSPSVFASILDDRSGGRFQISPAEQASTRQLYMPDTNVLVTRFLASAGVGEVTDFMPIRDREAREFDHKIVRRLEVVRGSMRFRVTCRPAFDYARAAHTTHIGGGGALFVSRMGRFALLTKAELHPDEHGVMADIVLHQGECVWFEMFALDDDDPMPEQCTPTESLKDALQNTVRYWRRWLASGQYTGRWREMVNRSALVLKLLTFQPTGAIVSAPTTSLPEAVGGVRNWDYRYTWIRDASFTLYGLLRVGFTEEARHFMEWLGARILEPLPDGLQIVYGIDGRAHLDEHELHHLDGYRGSRPVRVGNGAFRQRQLDIYGELMDSVYLYNKHHERQAFVQSYEDHVLDASALIMPLVFFMSPTDPRMLSTLDVIQKELVSDSLVYRFKQMETNDGLPGDEGTFSMCSFWLVEALTRAGRVDEARLIFEKMLTYAKHLGLYSEEVGLTGELLGNFPQGFTHLALISAAYNLNLALDRRRRNSAG